VREFPEPQMVREMLLGEVEEVELHVPSRLCARAMAVEGTAARASHAFPQPRALPHE